MGFCMMVVPLQAPRNCLQGAPVWKGENSVMKESPALIASCVFLIGRMFNGSCSVLCLFADVTGRDDPASRLSSGTETLADRMVVPTGRALPGPWFLPVPERSWNPRGPEGGKDESQRGRYSEGSSHLLEELVKEMEKAARGADQQTAQKEALQEGSPPTRPALDNETQAVQATGMPGMNAGNTTAAVRTFQRQRYISAIAAASAVLLSALVLACVAVSRMWKKYLEGKREKKAAKRAHPDTDGERVPTGDEGTVELGDGKRGLVPSDSLEEVSNDEIPVWERIPY
ncbi:uncharacterized protein LOC110391450 isoform X3 [Numida meleagris]|uniref:uncharacterized protein LOC110391450 isoform X3 n=1 Tax=Numida meleagris TaxID=8996 RepID=UPI000B3E3357|nr:uncharacterized protein LOC110391450 isoform X3 [Numida meleagris]